MVRYAIAEDELIFLIVTLMIYDFVFLLMLQITLCIKVSGQPESKLINVGSIGRPR